LSENDFIPTPDPGTTWYLLVGATDENTDGSELEALALSYGRPGTIQVHRDPGEPEDLHRGRVLEEGYDFSLRAYTFRKKGEDRVSFTLIPSAAQINPVFLINGWSAPHVQVTANGTLLNSNQYRAQVNGNDLTVWVEGSFTEATRFLFTS
jgi:hypothetical protein